MKNDRWPKRKQNVCFAVTINLNIPFLLFSHCSLLHACKTEQVNDVNIAPHYLFSQLKSTMRSKLIQELNQM